VTKRLPTRFSPRRYPQSPAAVRPWLVLSALSVLHDGERHAPAGHDDRPPAPERPAADPAASDPAAPEPAAADLAAAVPATTIVAAMAELPSQQRELIIELFYRGESLESAAAARDVPVGTLKSRLYYAMRALRAVLDQHVDRHDIR
jgi:RNA polymerase sigma-70 factor (ECF subfamily)